MEATICDACGTAVEAHMWPFCPHSAMERPLSIQPDELIGGFVQEHFGHQPEYFTSKSTMLRRADELNLRLVSDGDKKRGAYTVTPKTLADAKALLERVGTASDRSRATLDTVEFTVTPYES
jgi:hypothetical protein